MRTTLDIDDEVLAAAKERARRENTTVGKVVSYLARQALTGDAFTSPAAKDRGKLRSGFRPFPSRRGDSHNETIDALHDGDGY